MKLDCRQRERELTAVTEQRDYMTLRLGETQERMIDAERQRDRLADQIEANHKGTLMLERMVYQLREQRDMLAEALRNLMFYSEGYRMESYDKTIQEAEAALASVKGGSHE
jgi:hypothetical protein